jgi:U4/U6 small nuclear ribonucleoprotein PRP31
MSLEEFLSDLAEVTHNRVVDAEEYQSVSLGDFALFVQKPTMEQAASVAMTFQKEMGEIADIVRAKLTPILPQLVSLFPKTSDFIKVVLDLNAGRDSQTWLDRSKHLAMSTSLAFLDRSNLSRAMEGLQQVLSIAESIQSAQSSVAAYFAETVYQIAPSLTALLQDADLVARLVMAAGGLQRLATMPSANIVHVGKEHVNKKHGAQGILASSHLVTQAKLADQSKILKTLANKTGLAARVDAFKTTEAEKPAVFREAMEKRLKVTPLQPRTVKPLPIPAPKEKKHRAGKRVRKQKEKVKARVAASRVNFGVPGESEFTT